MFNWIKTAVGFICALFVFVVMSVQAYASDLFTAEDIGLTDVRSTLLTIGAAILLIYGLVIAYNLTWNTSKRLKGK